MKTIYKFETAKEIVDAFCSARSYNDESPFIPSSIKLSTTNQDTLEFIGDGSDKFSIDESIHFYDIVDYVLDKLEVRYEQK